MKPIGLALAFALLVSPIAAQSQEITPEGYKIIELSPPTIPQSQEREQKPSASSDARYIVIPKAGSLDWALLLDSNTGQTWRLGNVKVGTEEGTTETQWFWVPIDTCDTCR